MTAEVNTKNVSGRRTLRFNSFDELLKDAEALAMGEFQTLGNWSFGEILDHMAKSIHMMIDGGNFLLPAPVRWIIRLLLKKKFLSKTLPPGFKIPGSATTVIPLKEVSVEAGLSALRVAVERAKSERNRSMHPGLGTLSQAEWDAFQLRHCEMHMSFVVPVGGAKL